MERQVCTSNLIIWFIVWFTSSQSWSYSAGMHDWVVLDFVELFRLRRLYFLSVMFKSNMFKKEGREICLATAGHWVHFAVEQCAFIRFIIWRDRYISCSVFEGSYHMCCYHAMPFPKNLLFFYFVRSSGSDTWEMGDLVHYVNAYMISSETGHKGGDQGMWTYDYLFDAMEPRSASSQRNWVCSCGESVEAEEGPCAMTTALFTFVQAFCLVFMWEG